MKTKLSVFCNRVIEAGWLAAIVGVPLFFNIYTARTFEPDKITLMRSIVTVMIFAWLIKLIEQGLTKSDTSFRERFIAWLKRPMIFPTLLISIIYIISTAFSISPAVSFWGSYQRLQGTYTFLSYMVIFAMMVANMTTREQVDRFITTVIITSVPVALYGIIQKNGLDPLPWAGDVQKRVASNMGNAIFVASYLIMIIPITISRLVTSMKRMITSETHSWANTFLASTYIFVLAIQVITVIYSKSRGPQLGLLGAGALIGLLFLILLRQKADDKSMLSVAEVGQGLGFVAILGIATAILGGIGFGVGKGLESMLAIRWEVDGIYLFFAAVGTLMGFIGVYVYFAIRNQGWRWMWISWPIIGVMAIVFILALNGLMGDNPYLDKLRQVPYLGRLGQITDTEGGTGKVRVLIWEGVIELIKPHEPLGVEGEFDDDFNIIRPLIGYGPESMFNAFAYVYPPELAQVEARGSSADRSHNETMDSLAMTGIYGFIAFYLLMGSLFFYALKWLGWVPTRQSAMWLIGIMSACGLIGALIPYFIQGDFVLSAVGLPYGLFAGLVMYLCGQAFMGNTEIESKPISTTNQILLIGLLSAFLGHFLEVHFVFSIAATYTYFWAYLGLMVAMSRIAEMESEKKELVTIPNVVPKVEEKTHEKPRGRRRRGRSRNDSSSTAAWGAIDANGETWQMWTGSQGLTMAIILIILIFNFVTVQFDPTHGGYSFWWMTGITFLVGFSITVSSAANKIKDWHGDVSLVAVGGMYVITALSYAGLYAVVHGQQRASIQRGAADVITSANKVVGMLNGFYIALFLLMLIIGFTLVWGQLQGLQTWQMDNWWLYPPLILIMLVVISMKNIDVVKADIYLKEGERFRGAKKWDSAIRVHKESISVDRDEDFYYLMLALDYQLKAQDNKLTQEQRMSAWNEGERIALRAREINLYNPDNTGNMGRYYFTLAQVKSPEYYNDAIDFFEKAIWVTRLPPQGISQKH
ncbi:MAG: hypothetical protein B6242_04065 [Anaerolineaceae bacterium 4572_78]|nr:MAG: hypothetical protein B6242_04065 [Anaerolineaceae bacterium 4572_78]